MAFRSIGVDIVGILLRALGNKRFLITTIDYFTKWVEVEPLAQIREVNMKKFIHNNILSWLGISRALVSDNRTQFVGKRLSKWWMS